MKRQADFEVPTSTDDSPAKRHQSIEHGLIDGFSKLLSPTCEVRPAEKQLPPCRLDDLPQELLLNIFEHFTEPWVLTDDLADWEMYVLDRESRIRQQTLIALTKTCRYLNQPATSILYRCAHLPTIRSLKNFLSSLYIEPNLAQLVKQVSCPQDVLMTVPYVFQRSTNNGVTVPPSAPLFQPGRLRIGHFLLMERNSGPTNICHSPYVNEDVLNSVLERISHIRALSITCCSPWHKDYPLSLSRLEHLSKLSIATDYQPEIDTPNVADHPMLTWLNKSNLAQYPALKLLELVNPCGKWIANLVTVDAANGSGLYGTEKYVSSLETRWRNGGGTAEWDLLSLGRDIFSSAHLHTLDYTGQSRRCSGDCDKVQTSGWDLNLFLATKGRGIRTLSLDWEHEHTQLGQLGPTRMLTSLPMLTNLTHLTVSMQLLFQQYFIFYHRMKTMLEDPGAELARMLPASLRVLRIGEYLPGVLRPGNQNLKDRCIEHYNGLLLRFVQVLRAYWLDARDDRELWFRHCLELERHPRMADEQSRRLLRWLVSCQRHQDVGKEFARVFRMLHSRAAIARGAYEALQLNYS